MTTKKKKTVKKSNISFEKALERFEEIVSEMESGELGLDDAMRKYEEGLQAWKACHDILQAAEKRVELITQKGEKVLHKELKENEISSLKDE